MTRFRRLTDSYRLRLIVGYVLVVAIFSAAWLWSLYGPLTQAVLRQQQGNLTAVAQAGALVAGQSDQPAGQIAKQLVARTDLRLTIVAADGTVLADSQFDIAKMENHGDRPEIIAALSGETGTVRRYSETDAEEALYVAVPASLGGERVALRVSEPLSEIRAIASSSRRVGLLLVAVAIILASAIAVWAARAAVEPIASLSDAAVRMAGGDLQTAVPQVPIELEPLAASLSTLRSQMRLRLDALEAEKVTLSATLDGLDDAVLLVEGRTITLANRAAGGMFRVPHGGWAGTDIESVGLPSPLSSAITQRVESRDGAPFELEPDPTGKTYRILVSPLDAAARSGRTVIVITDITDRARLERMRRDFVANASHELKTPASGIRLLAQAIETAAADEDIEQALSFARQIEVETERLQRLVGDLLDLSRLESAPGTDAITDVRAAIDLALVSHRAAAERKGIVLVNDAEAVAGLDVFAQADSTDVAIALDNLLDNAISYTEKGSVIVRLSAAGDDVSVQVTDTGVGIDPEHLSRIFERFYRVDRGRSRDVGGTGLGLALVRHVMERSGGTVSVASQPGSGTEFTLRFLRAR